MRPHSKEFWLVAFFLSKFGERIENKGTQPPVELNTILWRVAYKKFFQSLGEGMTGKTFENGLKNCRDAYDGHTGTSARKGWRDENRNPVKLSSTAKSVYKKYNILGREKIWQEVQKYVSDDTKPNAKIK